MVGEGEVGEEEEDVFEVELASVDDVSFALRFAVGFEALEFESIPGATTLNLCELSWFAVELESPMAMGPNDERNDRRTDTIEKY